MCVYTFTFRRLDNKRFMACVFILQARQSLLLPYIDSVFGNTMSEENKKSALKKISLFMPIILLCFTYKRRYCMAKTLIL